MAKFSPETLRQVIIDGQITEVPARAPIADVVPREVTSITAVDLRSGRSHLIPREQFSMVVPDGFTTNLTPIAKG